MVLCFCENAAKSVSLQGSFAVLSNQGRTQYAECIKILKYFFNEEGRITNAVSLDMLTSMLHSL